MIESTLRILHNNRILGTGFLVAKDLVVTCAHVVTGIGETIQLQFTERDEVLSAHILPEYYRAPDQGDIAFLRLESALENIPPLRLGAAEHSPAGSLFQAFGYPSMGAVEGIHARGEVLGLTVEDGQRLLQLRSVELNQGHSGGLVWDEKRGVVVGMVVSVYKSDVSGKLRDTAFAVLAETLWQVCPEICPSETAPYRGLETFTAETARFFFGRDALTEKLLGILRGGYRFLAVFGPSGSGKSSLVLAGLLPALEQGLVPGSQKWVQVTFRPADDPFAQMKSVGLESLDLRQYLQSHPDAERLVLFIDQFEELFTLCPNDLRERFTRDLAVALDNSCLVLVISMRDDFYSAFNAKAAPLAESEHLKIENVPGLLKRDELIAMIERPAAAVGLVLEEGLTELILKDVTHGGTIRSATLPLLEFGLTQLWEQRRDGLLTHAAYQSSGGVTGSLARWADDAYSELHKAEQTLAESLLTALVHLGDEAQGLPDTRRRRSLAEFDEQTRRVIKRFADRRLLVTSGEMVELVHDALVREWGKLQGWVNKNRDQLRILEEVSEAAKVWSAVPDDPDLLVHRGGRLEDALKLSHRLSRQDQIYLTTCKTTQQRRRQTTIAGIGLAVLVIIGVLLGWVWTSNRDATQLSYQVATASAAKATAVGEANIRATAQSNAEAQKIEAEKQSKIALARQFAAQAQSLVAGRSSKEMIGVLLAIQSMRMLPTGEAAQILQNNTLAYTIARMMNVIGSVVFSPDGKYVAFGSSDHTVRVRNITTDKEITRMMHDNGVESVVFSPDGKYIASGSLDHTARVWDITTGREIARVMHDDSVETVAFSPDGKYVISESCEQLNHNRYCTQVFALVWDAATGEEIAYMMHDSGYFVAFSPDSKYVVSRGADNTFHVWEVTTGKEITHMKHDSGVEAVVFSPDGKYIISGSSDKTARVWESTTGKEIACMKHDSGVKAVAFSLDGKYVISGSSDKTVRIWEATTGKEIARMTHDDGVSSVAFSLDGNFVVSGSLDHTARVWDITTKKEIASMTHDDAVFSVAFSPNGKYVVSNSLDNTAYVWEIITKKEIAHMAHDDNVWSVAFSPDGQYLVSESKDKTVRVWEATTGKEVSRMTHDNYVYSSAFSPDGKYVVSGGLDCTVRLWETTTGKEIARMTHDSGVLSVAFSSNGKLVVSGSLDYTARVWEVATGKEIARMMHEDMVEFVAFSADDKYVFSGTYRKSARVWDVSTGKEIARVMRDDSLDDTSFSLDGKYVISRINNNAVRVWNVTTGEKFPPMEHGAMVRSVVFSPNSKYVVSGSYDRTARVWDVTTGKEIAHMTHDDSVEVVAFSPDSRYVVSGSLDTTARVWEATTGKEIARMTHDSGVYSVAFSPDGRYMVSASGNNATYVWIWRSEDLIAKACSHITRNLTRTEWKQYIGDVLLYQSVCPDFPLDWELIKTIAKDVLSNSGDPNRVETAFDKVKAELIKYRGIKDPITEAFIVVSAITREQISAEITNKDIEKALGLLEQAKLLQIVIENEEVLNDACWYGSLWGYSGQVIGYCEQALLLAPNQGYIRDSRGLARALTGDFSGAIDDFQFYIDELVKLDQNSNSQAHSNEIEQRQQWVFILKDGRNPFTTEILNELKNK